MYEDQYHDHLRKVRSVCWLRKEDIPLAWEVMQAFDVICLGYGNTFEIDPSREFSGFCIAGTKLRDTDYRTKWIKRCLDKTGNGEYGSCLGVLPAVIYFCLPDAHVLETAPHVTEFWDAYQVSDTNKEEHTTSFEF